MRAVPAASLPLHISKFSLFLLTIGWLADIVSVGHDVWLDLGRLAVHRYRIRQLPTFIAINSNKRDVTFFEYNRQVTVESLVDFASKCVPDGCLVYLKSAAAADQFLKSDPQKVSCYTNASAVIHE